MKTLKTLEGLRLKPISKEIIAICVERVTGDMSLAKKIRLDNSFDIVIVSSQILSEMEVELFKFNGEIPLYKTYCGILYKKLLLNYRIDRSMNIDSLVV